MLKEVKVNCTKYCDTFVVFKLKLKAQIVISKININLIRSKLFMCKSLVSTTVLFDHVSFHNELSCLVT